MKKYITIISITALSIATITLVYFLFKQQLNDGYFKYTIWVANKEDKVQIIEKIDENGNAIAKENTNIPYYLLLFNDKSFVFFKEGILYNGKYNMDEDIIIFNSDEDPNLFFSCKYSDNELTGCESIANRFTKLKYNK